MRFRGLIAWGLAAFILSAFGCAARQAQSGSKGTPGTFSEEILTVQAAKGKIIAPATGAVSIPYTRVDVLVDSGVAKQRFLQVLHNHSTTNQGFAFMLPLLPDTTITHFNLWDQGQRYVGAIEERVRAETVYKEVTGDEALEIRRDPGLVRQTGNVYEMRVFPIQPGEDKQTELFSHRRLGMQEGKFVLDLPLAEMARPRDARHGKTSSAVTEVSVWLRDELPITSVEVTGSEVHEERIDDHQRLLRLRWEEQAPPDIQVKYAVAIPPDGAITPWTVEVQGEQYFLLRVLQAAQEQEQEQEQTAPDAASGRQLYMGVWRPVLPEPAIPQTEDDAEDTPDDLDLTLETMAFLTLSVLDPNDSFQGAYRSATPRGGSMGLPSAATSASNRVADFERAYEEAFRDHDLEEAQSPRTPPDVVQHLTAALQIKECRTVYLFLGELPDAEFAMLARLVEEHPDRTFILVTEADRLPKPLRDRPNVSHYALRKGWTVVRHEAAGPRHVLLQRGSFFVEFASMMDLPPRVLARFWEKLPNLGRQLPSMETKGAVSLSNVQVYRGRSFRFWGRKEEQDVPGTPSVTWLSGQYTGAGEVELDVHFPVPLTLFGAGRQDVQALTLEGRTSLVSRRDGELWVAAVHARQVTETLGAEMRMLQERASMSRSRTKPDAAARKARLDELRREVARLSRTFGFISDETAFIALPPDLMRKYGLTPQQTAAQQAYNAGEGPVAPIPEPATWLLVALGTAMAAGISRLRRRRARI